MMPTPAGAAVAVSPPSSFPPSTSAAAACSKPIEHTVERPPTWCNADAEATVDAERPHDPSRMCRYPSKKCWNPRALKRNGERHNLCDFHREKANKNQRRLESKRKAKASAAAFDSTSFAPQPLRPTTCGNKRVRQHATASEPQKRTRKHRALLSAHVAMMEEARTKRQAAAAATRAAAAASATTSQFLHDLVLLEGVYDRSSFLAVNLPAVIPTPAPASGAVSKTKAKKKLKPMPQSEPTVERVDLGHMDEAIDSLLLEGDVTALCKDLDTNVELEEPPVGKTSPVDIGESWGAFGVGDNWMAPMEEFTEMAAGFDASSYLVDDDVFAAEV